MIVSSGRKKLLNNILNSIPVGIALIGLHGFVLEWNKKADEMFEYNEKNIVGSYLSKFFAKEERNKLKKFIADSFSQRKASSKVFKRLTKNNKKQYIEITPARVKSKTGSLGLILTLKDVTDKVLAEKKHKEAEKELIESEKKFHHMFDVASAAILIIDNKGNFIDINPSAIKLFGLPKKEIIGKNIKDFFDKEFIKQASKIKKSGSNRTEKGEFTLIRPDGQRREVEYSSFSDFMPGCSLCTLRDITDRKIEEKRQEYYLGILGHELKTPLAGIKAFAQITQRRIKKDNTKNLDYYLFRIDSQVDKLNKFINQLLDVTRIKAGKLTIYKEVFNFEELINEIIENFRETAKDYKFIKKGNAKINIIADMNRIEEVITNLISNAIKYSPNNNKVIINILHDKKNVTLSVRDFGVGIPKEKQNKIFEPFFRVGMKGEMDSGLGLGLYISSEIIKLHGGSMWVESTIDNGSKFYFTIPIRKSNLRIDKPG